MVTLGRVGRLPSARGLAFALTLALLLASSARAGAQSEDLAAARALFGEGRRLLQAGEYEAACPKLEAARSLYAGSGVLLNLGDCYEKTGRTASAWEAFGEAAAAAVELGRPSDEREAKRRQAALDARLTRLLIRITDPPPGLSVTRDQTPIDVGALESAIPVNPGVHAVRAGAPGYATWSTSVEVKEPGQTITVNVTLEPVPAPTTAPPAAAETSKEQARTDTERPSTPTRVTQHYVGLALGGAGLIALGAGGLLALRANSEFDAAQRETGGARHDDSLTAVRTGNAATITMIAGGVLVTTGAVVWLTAPAARVSVAMGTTSLRVSTKF